MIICRNPFGTIEQNWRILFFPVFFPDVRDDCNFLSFVRFETEFRVLSAERLDHLRSERVEKTRRVEEEGGVGRPLW